MIYLRFKARKIVKEERLVHKQEHARLKELHQSTSDNKTRIREQREAYQKFKTRIKRRT